MSKSLKLGHKQGTQTLEIPKKDETMDYLQKTGTGYYFRKRIPNELLPHYAGKKFIRKSLKTKDLTEAKLRCTQLALQALNEFTALIVKPATTAHKTVTVLDAALISKLAAHYSRLLLERDDAERLKNQEALQSYDYASRVEAIEFLKEWAVGKLAEGKEALVMGNLDFMQPDIELTANSLNLELIIPTDALAVSLKKAMLQVYVGYFAERVKRDQGEGSDTEVLAPPVTLDVTAADGSNVMALYDLWLKHQPRDHKTADTYKATAVQFNQWAKGIPAAAIKGEQVRDFISDLAQKLAYKTIVNKHKHLIAIGNIGVRYDKLPSNPFAKAVVTEDMGKKTEDRRPYAVTELDKLFKLIAANQDMPVADKWLPLLGLTTGARIRELCQISLADVLQEDGVWCLKIVNSGTGQKLKNKTSFRRIPLHNDLIAAGFIKFVDAVRSKNLKTPEASVFGFKPGAYDNPSTAYGKRFNKFVKQVHPELDFHSFRHTYMDLIRATTGYRKEFSDALTGHSSGTISDTYGGKFYPLPPLVELVNSLKLPVALPDLSHLTVRPADSIKNSRFKQRLAELKAANKGKA